MTAIELLNQLRKLNFTISADDDRLIVRGPKEGLPPELRTQLTKQKPEILELLKNAAPRRPAPLRRVPRDQDLCLSFAQQRLWFLDQLEPGKSIYNVPGALRLRGPLDTEALQRSLEEIVRRHEALRTTFANTDAGPVQVISPSPQFTLLQEEEIRWTTEEEVEAEIHKLAAAEANRPFDLSRGPLFRATLIRVAADDHVLLLTMHHIVSDGWSMSVLYRELMALYRAFVKGEASPLPELPIQYADFAIWQREWLEREELDRQLAYWKKRLNGVPALLNLRTDRPRPAVQSFRGKTQTVVFGKDLAEALKALNRREGVTLFMTLLAAFQTLLYRYTGQEDIVVGSPIANRNRTEIEGLIGFFVNTLVLRASFAGDPTFREFLASIRRNALEAYEHQDLPFEKLVEELNPHRTLSYTPLFQVMLVLQNAPATAMNLEGLEVNRIQSGSETAKFDLTLSVSETAEGLRTSLQYNTDLFEDATIARFLVHFEVLLRGIVHDPTKRISELPLITEAESNDLIERSRVKKRYEKHRCLHELFQEQASRTPRAVAMVFEDQSWTYAELDACANSLACTLRGHGVGPDVLVGLCTERSPELIVGILAILKAGGAYLPLDPSYPKQRIEFMLEDSDVSVIITQKHLVAELPAGRFSTVFVDGHELKNMPLASGDAEFAGTATPDSLAYVIYTSGSTGKPKGALITHSNVVRLFQSTESWFHFTSSDVWTLFHSCAFDFSVWEMWGALLHGGKLVIVPSAVSRAPDEFARLIDAHGVTVLNQTPSAFHQLMPHLLSIAASVRASLRYVIFGGEALEPQGLRPWFEKFGDEEPKLINMYGITETTVHVTYQPITSALVESTSASIIGTPLPDLSVYVLDAQRHLQPMGVAGEIYVGGAGVARGYLKRPELTAERFIADPFSGDPGARFYRSGDLARWLRSGQLEYLGRIDDQVKIRGYRIELGEIESILRQHPDVREAVTMVRGSDSSERCLVAYVEPTKNVSLISGELRSFLKERLPEHMIPAGFVLLEKFPLTANGKLDRNALPEPDPDQRQSASVYVGPRTTVEVGLCAVFSTVLRTDNVGVYDNFFTLGGHSLLATQVVARIRSQLAVELPLRRLFESPTVAALAAAIVAERRSNQAVQVPAIQPTARPRNLPLSCAQQRLWFLDQLESGNPAFNMNGTFRLKGLLNKEALERSLNEIVRRHESLRTTFRMVDGNPVQVIEVMQPVVLETIALQDVAAEARDTQARKLVVEDSKRAFDLSKGPLFRAQLIQLSACDHILGLRMHHIISDGWSLGVLYRELSALYRAYSSGQPSPLAELSVQYADYAIWQKNWLQGEKLDKDLAYWKEQLSGAPAVLDLPTDRQRPAVQTYHGGRVTCAISDDLYARLKTLAVEEGVTLFMLLLAAFQLQLSRYSGQDDIVVGSPVAGRNTSETEGLIGFFLNNLVLRTRLTGNPTFRELLARVRAVALGAFGHQELPFEKLLEELHPERDLGRTPLFQIYLNMLSTNDLRFGLEGLSVERFGDSPPESKFDLTLYVREDAGGLRFDLVYNADLFEAERMDEVLRQLEYLLLQVVDDPGRKINSYSCVTPSSKAILPDPSHFLEHDWKGSVHEQFVKQAKANPSQIAIIDAWEQWTYAQLNHHSNQLAHYLLKHEVRSGDRIVIHSHRSASLVCAVLGVLKAGAAFLILDPAYPAARTIACLEEAKPAGWLEIEAGGPPSKDLATFINTLSLQCRLVLPRTSAGIEKQIKEYSGDEPKVPINAHDLAYVSFTSGSTGKPKGVLGEHGSLSHFLPWQETTFDLTPIDRFTMLSGLSHDPLQRDMFTPLWLGATICIPHENLMGPAKLIPWLRDQHITFVHLTPAMLQAFVSADNEIIQIPTLRYVFFVGDRLTSRDVQSLRRFAPGVTCIASYGTTETQRAVGFFIVLDSSQGRELSHKAVYPLGRGIKDVQLLILNANRELAGIGEMGEIYVRSPHLARGYLEDDILTRSRFFQNPFTNAPHDRVYKTGDLGRYLPDGNIEFAGRVDEQVKIRGFRVELTEIQTALCGHSGIREAVVLKRDDDFLGQLIAYAVPAPNVRPSFKELRAFLKQRLPEHMVPATVVFLDSLPLTPNGKLDRSALPEPDWEKRENHQGNTAPRNAIEQVLAQIWSETLNVERIGIHDNFFDLGGHSLMGIRLIDQVCQELRIDLPLRRLFECPTVAELAENISGDVSRATADRRAKSAWRYIIELKPGRGCQPVFFLPGGIGGDYEFLVYARLTHFVSDEYTFYGLRARSADGMERSHRNVEDMATDYLKEMRMIQREGPYFIVGNCIGGIVAYETAQQLRLQGQEVALLALMDTPCPTPRDYRRYFQKQFRARFTNRLRQALATWRDNYYLARLPFHWHQFQKIGWRKTLPYVLRTTGVALAECVHTISNASVKESQSPTEMDREQIQQGYVDALRRYRPRRYLGKVVMLVNEKAYDRDPTLGWSELIVGGIDIRRIPGDHEAYIRKYVKTAAETLRDCLKSASVSAPSPQSEPKH